MRKNVLRLLSIGIIGILVLSGCSKVADESVSSGSPGFTGGVTEGQITDGASKEEIAPEAPSVDTTVDLDRKIIKSGAISIQSLKFNDTVENTIDKVIGMGGYIESSSISGYEGNRYGTLVVAIPSKNFDGFMNSSSELGNVIAKSSNSSDITDSYVDTQLRLKTLETRYDRLLELLKQSGSLEDLLKVEQEIGNVTLEIEKLKGTLQQYDKLIDMSRINIDITEVYQTKPADSISFADKIIAAFKGMGQNFIISSQNFVLNLIYSIPSLITVIVLAVIGILGFKWAKKNGKINNITKAEKKNKEENKE